jgi:hexulose-6-phosphate isomerase
LANPTAVDAAVDYLNKICPLAKGVGVELDLETSLAPREFADLLARVPLAHVNYDTGNSASLGFDPAEEFQCYGERIGSIHVKDRVLHGGSVPLGTGDTRFDVISAELDKIHYNGPFILEAARGEPGGELVNALRNATFARRFIGVL